PVVSSFDLPSTPPTDTYPLSLHDALPIYIRTSPRRPRRSSTSSRERWPDSVSRHRGLRQRPRSRRLLDPSAPKAVHQRQEPVSRSEEHTSELQSRVDLVCRLLLEKKKKMK